MYILQDKFVTYTLNPSSMLETTIEVYKRSSSQNNPLQIPHKKAEYVLLHTLLF